MNLSAPWAELTALASPVASFRQFGTPTVGVQAMQRAYLVQP